MEQTVFRGGTEGLTVEQVVRDYDYSMAARHFHDTYELYYLLEGQRYYFIDRQTYLVKAGDVVTMSAGCRHTVIAETELKLIEVQIGEEISVEDKQKFEYNAG